MFYESLFVSMHSSSLCEDACLAVLEDEQSMLMFNSSPQENNLTMLSPPLVRLYNFNDTIAER